MNILNLLESFFDRLTPKIQSIKLVNFKLDLKRFEKLVYDIAEHTNFKLVKIEDGSAILKIKGKIISSNIKDGILVFSGSTPSPAMYGKMKSKVHLILKPDGVLKVDSYEHVAAQQNEKSAIQNMLENRRDLIITIIEDRLKNKM